MYCSNFSCLLLGTQRPQNGRRVAEATADLAWTRARYFMHASSPVIFTLCAQFKDVLLILGASVVFHESLSAFQVRPVFFRSAALLLLLSETRGKYICREREFNSTPLCLRCSPSTPKYAFPPELVWSDWAPP